MQQNIVGASLPIRPSLIMCRTGLNGIIGCIAGDVELVGRSAFLFSVHFTFPFLAGHIRDDQRRAGNTSDLNHDHAIDPADPTIPAPLTRTIPCIP